MKLSILDQSPISTGATAQDALNASLELAKLADSLGYTRYWVAEHHDLPGLAGSVPEIMLSYIGSQTGRIRLGAGAILLPHYRPYKVAETFNLLGTLFPGRIDLGIGRAPGGSAEASLALSGNYLEGVRQMPEAMDELLSFLYKGFPDNHMYANVTPAPVPPVPPLPWLLGTSEKSAKIAAINGTAYAFGQFMSDQNGADIIKTYKEEFREKQNGADGKALITVSVICAETTEQAEAVASSQFLWKLQSESGNRSGIPTMDEARDYSYSAEDYEKIDKMRTNMIIGNPNFVKEKLNELAENYEVDEIMIVTITHDYQARLTSYRLISDLI